MNIRPENEYDYEEIRRINDLAFGQTNESVLIGKLRQRPEFIKTLSLVAEIDRTIAGHILFFPVSINNEKLNNESLSLGPMAVIPSMQKRGIGGKLVRAGLAEAKIHGFSSVIVLGHDNYYPRFGFIPAGNWGIRAPWPVPDEAFMAIELTEGGLTGISGIVRYPVEFDEAM